MKSIQRYTSLALLLAASAVSVSVMAADPNAGRNLASSCALCHGTDGKSVGAFPALEDEMCDFGLGGLSSGRSPDRLDALVWALAALMLTREGKPRVRGL